MNNITSKISPSFNKRFTIGDLVERIMGDKIGYVGVVVATFDYGSFQDVRVLLDGGVEVETSARCWVLTTR